MKKIILSTINKLPLGTIKKIKRFDPKILLARLEFFFSGKVSMPNSVIIDPCNICNLSCQLCPTGKKELPQKLCMMSFDEFKKIIDQVPSLARISLFNWGESLLNPEIVRMIKYARKKEIFVTIHSNLSFVKKEQFFRDLVKSGLNRLSVSLDGASGETYERYRCGGDFDLVLSNLKLLAKLKKETQVSELKIIWKFIVNKFNEEEVLKAKKMAKEIGVDFELTSFGLGDAMADYSFEEKLDDLKEKWLPENKKYIHDKYKKKRRLPLNDEICPFLFSQPVIDPDGNVYGCCYLVNKDNCFGDLKKDDFSKIWNNESFSAARNLFSASLKNIPEKSLVCKNCVAYRKRKM